MAVPHSQPTLSPREARAVARVLRGGHVAGGPTVRRFEDRMSRFLQVPHAVAVQTGTAALHLALLAMGARPGREVILPSYACSALLNAVAYTGARPVATDVDPRTLCLCPVAARKAVSKRTVAVIAAHMFGMPADLGSLMDLGPPVIEDAAMAVGGLWHNRPLASIGDAGILSFFATKVMTTGQGGMVTTQRHRLDARLRDLIEYDNRATYKVRYNYPMSDIAAAIGLEQLRSLPGFLRQRRRIAARYRARLRELPLEIPSAPEGTSPVPYRFVVNAGALRTPLCHALVRAGIESKRPVFRPLHRYLGLPRRDFPGTEQLHAGVLSLPIYPRLALAEVDRIGAILEGALP